jgi:hypothetical protein
MEGEFMDFEKQGAIHHNLGEHRVRECEGKIFGPDFIGQPRALRGQSGATLSIL